MAPTGDSKCRVPGEFLRPKSHGACKVSDYFMPGAKADEIAVVANFRLTSVALSPSFWHHSPLHEIYLNMVSLSHYSLVRSIASLTRSLHVYLQTRRQSSPALESGPEEKASTLGKSLAQRRSLLACGRPFITCRACGGRVVPAGRAIG